MSLAHIWIYPVSLGFEWAWLTNKKDGQINETRDLTVSCMKLLIQNKTQGTLRLHKVILAPTIAMEPGEMTWLVKFSM